MNACSNLAADVRDRYPVGDGSLLLVASCESGSYNFYENGQTGAQVDPTTTPLCERVALTVRASFALVDVESVSEYFCSDCL